ncbi:hypothetical protein [Thalassococcus lentus]|uniref:Uncharacterized protein n=1 Tax=Thalassococcus lentus TaxID=1210524 RepID=A0ABT4XRF2_9RHOB|nr:hypothetical protein [Thalassococcus lentus]MDA7424524.1 hypothetical protein [Thalassococcus lentus]
MKNRTIKPWLIAQLAVLTLLAVYGVSAGADAVQACDLSTLTDDSLLCDL